jgi:hypothetical protein
MPDVRADGTSFSLPTAALVVAMVFVVTILCGVAPALHATDADLNASLKAGDSGLSASSPRRRTFTVHELFAGSQLILAMVLLTSTGLLLHSMVARLRIPLGFQPQDVAVVKVVPPILAADRVTLTGYWQQHPNPFRSKSSAQAYIQAMGPVDDARAARNELLYLEATRRVAELPGVVSVAVMNPPPFTNGALDLMARHVLFDPHPSSGRSEILVSDVLLRYASMDAFRVLGIPLRAGRTFIRDDIPPRDAWKYALYGYRRWSDVPEPPPSGAVINETLARRLWPNENPLGRMLYEPSPLRIIGVVADVHESRNNLDILPTVYIPFTGSFPIEQPFFLIAKLRPGARLGSFATATNRALTSLSPGLPPPLVLPLQEPLGNLQLALALLGCFSLLGIVVAGLGVHATATLMAAARTRETGIRFALGATSEQICGLALWRSLRLAFIALPVGALASWALARGLAHWLFQVGTADPVSYLASAALLLAIALAAGLLPALRAMTVDPATALRYNG